MLRSTDKLTLDNATMRLRTTIRLLFYHDSIAFYCKYYLTIAEYQILVRLPLYIPLYNCTSPLSR